MRGPNDISAGAKKRAGTSTIEIAAEKAAAIAMSTPTLVDLPAPLNERFKYMKSERKDKSYELRNSNRKRLFNEYAESTSSDEEVDHIDKKVKLMKQPLNYNQSILKTYQTKDYAECLKLIEEFLQLPTAHPQYKPNQSCSQYKIIQAACWTMTDVNHKETLESLQEIIKAEPTNSFALYGLGLAQYLNGDLTRCMDSFGTAINLNPTGAMKRAMEFKSKAKSFLDLLRDANAQFDMNHCSRAVEMLNAAVFIDSDNKKMIKTIVEMRDHFVKELVHRMERDVESEFPDKFSEVEQLILSNQLGKADKMVEEIYSEEPKTGRSTYIKALALYKAGSLNESMKFFTASLVLDGTQQNAKRMESKARALQELIAKAAEEMSDIKYEAAIETFTAALHVDRENRVINQAAYFQRALAHFNLGHFESAFEDYKKFESMKKFVGNVLQEIDDEDHKKAFESLTKKEDEEEKVAHGIVSEIIDESGEVKIENMIEEPAPEEQLESKLEVCEENFQIQTESLESQPGDVRL